MGSSSGALLLPVKREPGELPPLRVVKRELGKERPRGRGVIGSEDYRVGPVADAFKAALAECAACK